MKTVAALLKDLPIIIFVPLGNITLPKGTVFILFLFTAHHS
jgi:hypothetical protein